MARPSSLPPVPPGAVSVRTIVGEPDTTASTARANRAAARELHRLAPREQLSASLRRLGPRLSRRAKPGLWPGAVAADVWGAVSRGHLTPLRGGWGIAFSRAEVEAYAERNPLRRRAT